MTTTVPATPDLPKEVRDAAKNGRLLIFLGAGVSCAVGCPSWAKVKEDLIATVRSPNADGDVETFRNQLRELDDYYDCFEKIHSGDETKYKETIRDALSTVSSNKETFLQIIRNLRSIGPKSLVTTNMDPLLSNTGLFDESQFRSKDECTPQELSHNKVFFIHGFRDKHVFRREELLLLYGNSAFKSFLHNAFGSYSVLFVGFSLQDRELLAHARLHLSLVSKPTTAFLKHYALLPSPSPKGTPSELSLADFGILPIYFDNSDGSYKTSFQP